MTPEDEAEVRRIVKGVDNFAEDMRLQGIHVGMGSHPTICVVDGEMWPCQHVRNDHRGAGQMNHELRLIQQRPDLVALIHSADETGALPPGAVPRQMSGTTVHDKYERPCTTVPTHWKVRVKLGVTPLPISRSHIPQSLRVVFRQVLYAGMFGRTEPTHAEAVFEKLRTAQTQATMASRAGLDVRLTPCVLVELPDIGGEDARPNVQTYSS